MSKKKRMPKRGPVWHQSAEDATLRKMPRYNAHLCKTGAHGDAKYNRAKEKRTWMRNEARDRGPRSVFGPFANSTFGATFS